METWFIIIVTACLALLVRTLISWRPQSKLPPGPRGVPIISALKWVRVVTSSELEPTLKALHSRFGPIVTLPLGSRPLIFVSSRTLTHQALVQSGPIFAGRPEPLPTAKVITAFKYSINSTDYGPYWRTLRRNLATTLLHPSRLKEYSHARKWVLDILTTRFISATHHHSASSVVKVIDHVKFAMTCLLVHLVFGVELEESTIRDIDTVQNEVLLSFTHNDLLNFFPNFTRIFFPKRWEKLLRINKKQRDLFAPLIEARRKDSEKSKVTTTYVDTLLNLEIQDDEGKNKRRLTEEEVLSACSEILAAGTDTSSTTLEWIMANLVKYPEVQAKLFDEIRGVVGAEAHQVEEEELPKIPYLKAVVLEGLRRHPPGHFVLPHSVTEDVELGGYLIPKNTIINFAIADLGLDPEVWEDPMEFKPERFIPMLTHEGSDDHNVQLDITGNRGIKMMPFGAGRRICPGMGLAILIMEYLVANLVFKFHWTVAEGHEVDLSEELQFTTMMKYPLHARVSQRNVSYTQQFPS